LFRGPPSLFPMCVLLMRISVIFTCSCIYFLRTWVLSYTADIQSSKQEISIDIPILSNLKTPAKLHYVNNNPFSFLISLKNTCCCIWLPFIIISFNLDYSILCGLSSIVPSSCRNAMNISPCYVYSSHRYAFLSENPQKMLTIPSNKGNAN
jgi:hypothetical protein